MLKIILHLMIIFVIIYAQRKSPKTRTKRVVGGDSTKHENHQYHVAINRKVNKTKYIWHCGGSVLNGFFVLTAAHCVYNVGHRNLVVRGYSSECCKGGVVKDIYKVFIHENYNFTINPDTYENDIAILELMQHILLDVKGDMGEPYFVNLPTFDPDELPTIVLGQILGWSLEGIYTDKDTKLRKLNVRIIDKNICTEIFHENAICASNLYNNDGSCHRDDGSGLYVHFNQLKDVQIGIVSIGYGCGTPYKGYMLQCTNVYKYIKWIQNTLRKNEH